MKTPRPHARLLRDRIDGLKRKHGSQCDEGTFIAITYCVFCFRRKGLNLEAEVKWLTKIELDKAKVLGLDALGLDRGG